MKQNKVLCVLVCVLSGIILLMIAGIVLILLSPDGEETSEYLAGSRGVIGFYGRGLTTDGDDLIVDTPELSLVLTPVDDDDVSGIEGERDRRVRRAAAERTVADQGNRLGTGRDRPRQHQDYREKIRLK